MVERRSCWRRRACLVVMLPIFAAMAAAYIFPAPCEPLHAANGEPLATVPLCRLSRVYPHTTLLNAVGTYFDGLLQLEPESFAKRRSELLKRYPVAAARAFPIATQGVPADDYAVVAADINTPGRTNAMAKLVLAEEAETSLSRFERLLRFFEAHPGAAASRPGSTLDESPLVLCGLPRTGSSMLQRLLSLDPKARSLPLWVLEADPLDGGGGDDAVARASAAAEAGISALNFISPDAFGRLMAWHNMTAHAPEEDIMWMYAASPSTWDMAWMLAADSAGDSASLRRALQPSSKDVVYEYLHRLLQAWSSVDNPLADRLRGGGRDRREGGVGAADEGEGFWVLKTHLHTLYLPTLLERFPKAKIVMTHRDVRRVLASYVALQLVPISALVRGVGEGGHVEAVAVRAVSLALAAYCRTLARRALEFDAATRERQERPLHLRHEELMMDPVRAVEQIYTHFGMRLTDSHREAMQADLASNPPRASGAGRFSLMNFGLDEAKDVLTEDVKEYHRRFLGLR